MGKRVKASIDLRLNSDSISSVDLLEKFLDPENRFNSFIPFNCNGRSNPPQKIDVGSELPIDTDVNTNFENSFRIFERYKIKKKKKEE